MLLTTLCEQECSEPTLTLEKAIALGQYAEKTKIHAKQLRQKTEIYGIKSNEKENRYLQLRKNDKKAV